MTISTYDELVTAVGSWIKRSDLTASIPDFVRMGELRIYRDLRVRAMEATLNSAIASGVVAVPSGYVAMKHAYIDGTPVQKLQRKDAEWVYQNYPVRSASGQPKFFAREADNFIFGPYPDDGYTVKGIYYKRLTALGTSNQTNWFTENAPDLLLWAALVEAEPFVMNDARTALWAGKYETTKERIQREDDAEDSSGSVLSMTAG
jgi:hypothetical protein